MSMPIVDYQTIANAQSVELTQLREQNRKLRERIKELEPAVSHVIARCSSCGNYVDDIEWHYKPIVKI